MVSAPCRDARLPARKIELVQLANPLQLRLDALDRNRRRHRHTVLLSLSMNRPEYSGDLFS